MSSLKFEKTLYYVNYLFMYIRIFKDFMRGDSMQCKKRFKHGKGKLTAVAGGEMFNHYESTDKSVFLEVGTDDQRQEAKLYQRRNEFISHKAGEPKTESCGISNNSANRAFLKAAGRNFQVSANGKKLLTVLRTPSVNVLHKGRFSSPKSFGRVYIDLPIDSNLNTILSAAFKLSAKIPECPIKRKQVCERNEQGWSVFPKGDYVLNCKVLILNEGEAPLRSILGSATKGCFNIHEVRMDKMCYDSDKNRHFCLFNKSTIAKYCTLVNDIHTLVEAEIAFQDLKTGII